MNNDLYDEPILAKPSHFPSSFIASIKRNLSPKYIILIGIISIATLIVILLTLFKPTAQKQDIPETVITVDVIQAARSNYPIIVKTNGIIEADTRGNLVSQISGEIIHVSKQFKAGGSFNKGDILVKIDDRDFLTALSNASASVSQAKANYQQELANAKQAEQDWKRLGNTKPAPALVKREPQLAAAKAQLDSALATQAGAKLNLARTKFKAPYTGRIIRRDAALGQYISTGSVLAEIFATDIIEVNLPLSQDEYSQLGLETINLESTPLDVILSSKIANKLVTWPAKLTRTDSVFDPNTRQINAVATVLNPFNDNQQPKLKIGQFVNAQINGLIIKDVFVLPNRSIREGNSVFTVRDQRLEKVNIDIVWQDDNNAVVKSGINNQELIVTTSLNSSVTGSKVKLTKDFIDADKLDNTQKKAPQTMQKTNIKPTTIQKTKPANNQSPNS